MKGSGGDLGSMKLDGFATLYMDKLNALKGLYRGVEHEDEMVGYLPHATFNLNPRAASIDTPLHAYPALPACRPRAPGRGDRHRRVEEFARADARRSTATRSAGCRGSGRASSSACGWRNSRARIRRRRAACSKATASSPGPTTPRPATRLTLDVINRAIAWFERETARQGGLRRRGGRRRCRRSGGARSPRG